MSVSMALFRWSEITATAWVISLVIVGSIALLALPYMKGIVGIVRLTWLIVTGDWSGGW